MEAFLSFYQNLPSTISPVLFSLGGFELRWYSLGYVFALLTAGELTRYRIRRKENTFPCDNTEIYDAYIYILIGIILGGRLGYLIFYDFNFFQNYPLRAFLPFTIDENGWSFTGISGMSYHGGLIGVCIGLLIFTRMRKISFWHFLDFLSPGIALGYTFGRLGNFMNGELYGRITEVPWGMYFLDPASKIPFEVLRHPSQLYEAFTEGILVFIFLYLLRNKPFPKGWLASLYMIGYAVGRFIVEFFRQPDELFKDPGETLGTVWGFLTMGQILCLTMILVASVIMILSARIHDFSLFPKQTPPPTQ